VIIELGFIPTAVPRPLLHLFAGVAMLFVFLDIGIGLRDLSLGGTSQGLPIGVAAMLSADPVEAISAAFELVRGGP